MPAGLCSVFSEQLRFEPLINAGYTDGSSDRVPGSQFERHFFQMTRPVTPSQWSTLWQFYQQHPNDPFWFYNLRETVPPFHWDPSGNATDGRYIVVFDGTWSDEFRLGRSNASFGLREVA
jgi:hypothetical protein